jgi:hypothetical protein
MLYLSFMSVRGFMSTVPPAVSNRIQPAAMSQRLMPCFDVSVEPSARHVSHVERGAAHQSAFPSPMHHFLEQRQTGRDRHAGLRQADRDDGFTQIGPARLRGTVCH